MTPAAMPIRASPPASPEISEPIANATTPEAAHTSR